MDRGIAEALRRGQSDGTVRRDLRAEEVAGFLVAMYEGYAVLAKNSQDVRVWNVGIKNIVGWLRSLRPAEDQYFGVARDGKTHDLIKLEHIITRIHN
jgi:hypothetical protein